MTTQKAIVMDGKTANLVTDRPMPTLRPGHLLVKVHAVGLNPADWKGIDYLNEADALAGCDFAGVVEQVGTGYTKQWQVGDRIAGMAFGGNELQHEDGAFAEHIVVRGDITLKIPDNLSFEEAATLGVAYHTAGQGLFLSMGLDLPEGSTTGDKDFVFIYGGSTAMGTAGIQLAKLAGYKVITACSPRNFDLVKGYGVDHVFDYQDPQMVDQVERAASGHIRYIWDTISSEASAQLSAQLLAPDGKYRSLFPVVFPRDGADFASTMAFTAFGERVKKGQLDVPAKLEDYQFAHMFTGLFEALLSQRKFKVHPPQIDRRGLAGVRDGLDLLRQQKVSGHKLVCSLVN